MTTHDNLFALDDLIRAVSPYPWITRDGGLHDGLSITQPKICQSCSNRSCASTPAPIENVAIGTCYRGMNLVTVVLSDSVLRHNGLTIDGHREKQPRRLKKSGATRLLTAGQVSAWASAARSVSGELELEVQRRVATSLGSLHDVITAASSVMRHAERLVSSYPGETFEERLDKLSPEARSWWQATDLLERRLSLVPLLGNPAAASHGQKRSKPIYRIVEALVHVLRPVAQERHVTLRVSGRSFKLPLAYQSVDMLPLLLIENAIKYSQEYQSVEIEVNDWAGGVEVSVSSYSPLIPPEEQIRIFERGFRGRTAATVADHGSGLGLYLAQLVAQAHKTEIRYEARGAVTLYNGVPYCNNVFSFVVR